MRLRFATLFTALCLTASVLAQDLPAPVEARLAEARSDCAAFENGTLTLERDALTRTDLTGDGTADLVVDLGRLTCSSAPSLYCGTGGCTTLFVVGDTVTERLSKGWDVARFGPLTVLLTQRHGSDCGGTNLRPCVEALVWDAEAGQFASLAD